MAVCHWLFHADRPSICHLFSLSLEDTALCLASSPPSSPDYISAVVSSMVQYWSVASWWERNDLGIQSLSVKFFT